MSNAARLLLLAVLWGLPGQALAEPNPKTAIRRDPKGLKGISPFMDALKRGDSALLARDFDGAIAAYRAAIASEPENALGHYRVGEAQLAKGDFSEAEQAFGAGLRVVRTTDGALAAKLRFALCDLRERLKVWDGAIADWGAYESFANEQKVGFPSTASARKKAISAWQQLSRDSAEVKARIEKGVNAADEAVRKSSK